MTQSVVDSRVRSAIEKCECIEAQINYVKIMLGNTPTVQNSSDLSMYVRGLTTSCNELRLMLGISRRIVK